MTLNLLAGAQDAVIALLRAQLPASQRPMVRHTLPENASPPWHLIGDVDTEDEGSATEQLETVSVDVQTVYRGADRRELLSLIHEVRLATDRKKIVIDGASYRFRWVGAVASTFAADGVTAAAVTSLKITAEPV